MFWNRKKKPDPSFYDLTYRELVQALLDADRNLQVCVEAVITCKGVVALYPNGPDKEAARKALKAAKFRLLCAIGAYDGRLNETKQYYSKHKSEFVTCAGWSQSYPDSHKLIEDAYRAYWKRR